MNELEQFLEHFAQFAEEQHLDPSLPIPDALDERANELERFLMVVFSDEIEQIFRRNINLLRDLSSMCRSTRDTLVVGDGASPRCKVCGTTDHHTDATGNIIENPPRA